MALRSILTLCIILVIQGLAQQVPFSVKQIITPGLSQFVNGLRADENIPGLTLGLVHSDGQVEYGAWGIKDEDGAKATTDTAFILASCSKAFLSAAMGILIDDFTQGKNVTPLPPDLAVFDWSTKVVDILPGQWQLQDEWATKKASIRDILSHVSGVPRHDYSPLRTDAPIDIVLNLKNLRPTYELREKWSYNNLMFISAAHLISVYSGMPYTDFVKERIFIPLGMTSTTYSPTEAARDYDLTQSWAGNNGRRLPTWFTDEMRDLNAGPGGVISTAVDMTKWLRTLLNQGVNKDTNTTVIPKSAFDAVTTSHAIVAGRAPSPDSSILGYGMGWSRESYKGHEFVSHSGGIPGFSTMVGFLPGDDLGIVVLTNADAKHEAVMKLIKRIIEDAVGLDTSAWDTMSSIEKSVTPASQASHPPQEMVAEPSLPIERYAGKYWDSGYGTVTLCAGTSTSPVCLQVLDEFARFDNVTSEDARHTLYAAYESMWSSHIRFLHAGGDDFSLVFTALFPDGCGKDTSPFETWEAGEGEALAKFELHEDPSSGEKRVVAFGFMGTEEEQEGRKRLVGNHTSITALAEVVMTRLGPV